MFTLLRFYLHKSIAECHKLLGVNGFLIKQKHIAGVHVPCSSFRSVRLPNLDVEAETGRRAYVSA